ncbi:MAG: SGNH/GDSL hydrolase family protein [Myxococcota bacterium]|nr:SGNH/GDSL hydrolase family protein [Myxococcota bacterium]
MLETLLAGALSVLLVGDSHTVGLVQGGGPSFSQVLGEELGEAYEVRVAGCGGSTVLDWTRERQRGKAGQVRRGCMRGGAYALARAKLPADFAVVLLGTNDAAGFGEAGPVPPKAYGEAMQELVAALLQDGVRHVVLVIPPPSAGPWVGPRRRPRLEAYRLELHALADANEKASRGPDLLALIEVGTHLRPGAVHLNAAGHRLLGERLARDVRAVEEEAR